MKKKLLIVLACVIACIGVIFGIYYPDSDINNSIDEIENAVIQEIQDTDDVSTPDNETEDVIVSEQTEETVIQTLEAIESGDDLSTTEVIESSEEEEQEITDEGALETDAVLEQENISYDGTNTGNGLSLLGNYQGLTYYSQADSRWASIMYSSIGDSSQTIKSSGCGITAGAMIVSSSKGAILPTTMASLSVDNGYRTANNGTAWAYFPFIADYFDFNEYYCTYSFDTMLNYLKQKDSNGNSKYYVVASCRKWTFYNWTDIT